MSLLLAELLLSVSWERTVERERPTRSEEGREIGKKEEGQEHKGGAGAGEMGSGKKERKGQE